MGRKKKIEKHRDLEYRADLPERLVEFFNKTPYTIQVVNGKERKVPGDLPHISDFLRTYGIKPRNWRTWIDPKNRDIYPELQDAWEQAQLYYEKFLTTNALKGYFNTWFAIFQAKNKMGWRDRVEMTSDSEKNTWAGVVVKMTKKQKQANASGGGTGNRSLRDIKKG